MATKTAKPREYTCEQCNQTFEHRTRGQLPRFCPTHRDKKSQNKDLRLAASRGDKAAREELERRGIAPVGAMSELGKQQRFAIMYGASNGNFLQAAEAAGVSDPIEIANLIQLADTQHKSLKNISNQAIGEIGNATMALLMIRLRDSVDQLPPATLGNALKQTADVMERITGGVTPSFAEINVKIDLGE